jgi:hypothetical protein
MNALYRLSQHIASFNFFEWLLYAQTQGATHVNFDAQNAKAVKWPADQVERRFRSILLPGPALAGMTHSIGSIGHDFGNPSGALAVAAWKSGKMRRLCSVKAPGNERYTVTLRKTYRANGRDSDEEVWRTFADEIGARVIPDYDIEPIHLHDRVALYAGAEMNFFVSNGPGVLCSFTEYPCMIFDTHLAAGSLKSDGVGGWGAQYPWMVKNQYAIWQAATLANIRRHFYSWTQGNYDPNATTAPRT